MLLFMLLALVSRVRCDSVIEDPGANDQRTLLQLIWSCSATIFACTWLAVHPNVPGRALKRRGRLAIAFRRAKLMLLTIIVPEIIIGWAAAQWRVARYIKNLSPQKLTMAHGFFVAMGGFCNSHGDILCCKDLYPIGHERNGESCRESWIDALAGVPEEEMEERSKADAFSKGIAIIQISWFALQCLARVIQDLPIVPIEMSALAFSVLSIVLYMIWWYKPFDIQVHIVLPVGAKLDYADHEDREHVGLLRCINDWYYNVLVAIYGCADDDTIPTIETGVSEIYVADYIDNPSLPSTPAVLRWLAAWAVGALFGSMYLVDWSYEFPSNVERTLWRTSAIAITSIPLWFLVQGYSFFFCPSHLSMAFAATCYITARICIIVLALMSLRCLLPAALVEVSWTMYIPHV
ncbi:uncharacterized protein EV420DRAFT_115020 [Desarmillaria tabescens]|uniref:Uncharacterized protein n=1 Tax=Armillaria tabescens TaxID=1929756 RepID=A0AA39TUD9_ARMTA|nr:uncharacterized protein EV420DRAFT_115020 [Desarmillaria tabescens]KAK0470442.1 hypothetical protein EV420DRAFT_115020 [Desarmillaria tabescens]